MGTPEFPSLGRHCSVASCQQIDFLPFSCDKCLKVYCLEHRSYAEHSCPTAKFGDSVVIVCPLCAKSIPLPANSDANEVWNRHISTASCDPNNYSKATKRKRCPVKGCREPLTFSNKFLCKECSQETCLKHRFGPDHACAGKPPPPAVSFFGSSFLQSLPTFQNPQASSSNKRTPGSSVGGGWLPSVGQSTRSTLSKKVLPPVGKKAGPSSRSSASTASTKPASTQYKVASRTAGVTAGGSKNGPEVCPQCQEKLPTVEDLIRHVENVHLGGSGRPPRAQQGYGLTQGGVGDVCPTCGTKFSDVGALVRHVEGEHLESSQGQCRVS